MRKCAYCDYFYGAFIHVPHDNVLMHCYVDRALMFTSFSKQIKTIDETECGTLNLWCVAQIYFNLVSDLLASENDFIRKAMLVID